MITNPLNSFKSFMGLISIKEVKIDNAKTIKTSFPNFYNLMIKIGAKLIKK